MAEHLLGIDVSHHQPDVDWAQVAGARIAFAFCRATYGIREDRKFISHFQGAKAAGLATGAYHFLRFNDRMTAEAQAQAFLETLSDAGALHESMLPPVLDLEDNGRFDEVVDTAAERRAYVALAKKWLAIVEEELDRTAIIYTTRSFFNQIGNPAGFSIRPLWVAHYTTRPSPRLPDSWSRHTFWQFTDEGRVLGIDGGVDMNRFEGDIDALRRLDGVVDHPILTTESDAVIDEDSELTAPRLGAQGVIRHVIPKGLNIRSEARVADHTLITTLPLAHPVEALESGIAGSWARVRTLVRGEEINGFVAERFLREPLPNAKEVLIAEAVKEWLRFRRGAGKETQAPYFSFVGEMWQALGRNLDGRDTSFFWSAAFISFIVKKAGPAYQGFQFSARHSTYIHDAIVKRESGESAPFWGHRLEEYAPKLGDMVAQWRETPRTYEQAREQNVFPSHVDVVVRLTATHAVTIGGNVSNSVSMKEQTYELDDNGFLKSDARTFSVLENRAG